MLTLQVGLFGLFLYLAYWLVRAMGAFNEMQQGRAEAHVAAAQLVAIETANHARAMREAGQAVIRG